MFACNKSLVTKAIYEVLLPFATIGGRSGLPRRVDRQSDDRRPPRLRRSEGYCTKITKAKVETGCCGELYVHEYT